MHIQVTNSSSAFELPMAQIAQESRVDGSNKITVGTAAKLSNGLTLQSMNSGDAS
jgi:hypothetical protein